MSHYSAELQHDIPCHAEVQLNSVTLRQIGPQYIFKYEANTHTFAHKSSVEKHSVQLKTKNGTLSKGRVSGHPGHPLYPVLNYWNEIKYLLSYKLNERSKHTVWTCLWTMWVQLQLQQHSSERVFPWHKTLLWPVLFIEQKKVVT